MGGFSPSWGVRACSAELQLSIQLCTPSPASPPLPPALSQLGCCLRPYLYFNAASKPGAFASRSGGAGPGWGDNEGRGAPPAEGAAFLGEGRCPHPNSALSLHPSGSGPLTPHRDPSAGSPPNPSAATVRGWGLQPTGNTRGSASCRAPTASEDFWRFLSSALDFHLRQGWEPRLGPSSAAGACALPPLPQFPFPSPSP